MLLRAQKPGPLPTTANAIVAGVKLPTGRLLVPDRLESGARGGSSPAAVAWRSDDLIDDPVAPWTALATRFSEHGLWPLMLQSMPRDDARPWLSGELDPAMSSSPDGHDAAAVLANQWSRSVPLEDEADAFAALAPFDREFPGLAPATVGRSGVEFFASVSPSCPAVSVSSPSPAPPTRSRRSVGWGP